MDSKEHDHMENNSVEPSKGVTSYDLGIGRLYECVFCKRGFTTAQALGGHMNIHRKDRTKPKLIPCPSSSSNHRRFLIDAPQSGFLSPCCKENQCSDSSGTQSTGILSSHNPVQEIGTIKLSPVVGFNKHHHHVVEEVDLELRLGHHSP